MSNKVTVLIRLKEYFLMLNFVVNLAAADLSGCETVDLSHPFDENTTYWVTVKPFRFTKKIYSDPENGDADKYFYTANEFEAGEHGGTHLDAPYHFNKKGWKVGQIPVRHLAIVNGIIVDAKKEAAINPDYLLTVDKFSSIEKEIIFPTVIILNFGWAEKYSNKNEYYGSKTLNNDDLHFPGLSKEAADWIANNDKVVGVGMDTASLDSGINAPNPFAHITVTGKNKYILENLDLHEKNLQSYIRLIVAPMKIKNGSGAPCRVFALPISCVE